MHLLATIIQLLHASDQYIYIFIYIYSIDDIS